MATCSLSAVLPAGGRRLQTGSRKVHCRVSSDARREQCAGPWHAGPRQRLTLGGNNDICYNQCMDAAFSGQGACAACKRCNDSMPSCPVCWYSRYGVPDWWNPPAPPPPPTAGDACFSANCSAANCRRCCAIATAGRLLACTLYCAALRNPALCTACYRACTLEYGLCSPFCGLCPHP